MNIGIIVHSNTGNTLSVAEKLNKVLVGAGHTVKLEQVTAVTETGAAPGNVQLKNIPQITEYDMLIFGAPVNAFSLSQAMKAYLSQLPSLQGKKVGCYVTQQLPFAWMGGNHAISEMEKICAAKGATVLDTGIVNWSDKKREEKITSVLDKLQAITAK